jgi:hypothetical protein
VTAAEKQILWPPTKRLMAATMAELVHQNTEAMRRMTAVAERLEKREQ